MLFDLNFDDEEKQSEELSNTSSSSSVVNAAAAADDHRVTHQLFPTTTTTAASTTSSDRVIESLEFAPTTTTTNEWLKLSVSSSCSGSGSGLGSDKQKQVRKSRRGPRSRSSQYRGVTFYRRTGRWESHIWDCGKQVYLGGFDTAHTAARAYDRAAIKFRGVEADINFNITDYEEDMKQQVKNMSKEEFVQVLRRQTTGLSRGNSRVRGITLPKCGLWEAPMVQFLGNNGYDHAATVQCNSRENVTNFEPKSYDEQTPILVNNEGHGHNLDLNLGISVTIDGSTTSNNMGVAESRITHGYSVQLSNGKRAMNKASPYHSPGAVPLYGQPMVYRQPTSMWSALSHGRTATHEEKVSEQKNFPMYMASRGQGDPVKQVQILPRAAASSGFPFSTATTSNTLFTHHQHSQGRQ